MSGVENSLLCYLERAAKHTPEREAYEDAEVCRTYGEMWALAQSIGTALHRRLGTVKRPVAIYMEKSVDCVAAFFGVLASGNFYCPIDPEMPADRISRIMEVLQPEAVITAPRLKEQALAFAPEEKLSLFQDLSETEAEPPLLRELQNAVTEADPAYVLFTSGSTGMPKGVLLCHRVLMRYLHWLEETFDYTPDDVFGNQAPLYFDISTHDIYGAAYFGAKMTIIPPHLFGFPVKLIEYLNEKRVSTFLWVPSAMGIVAKLKTFRAVKPEHLRHVMFAGEVLPRKQLDYWVEQLPEPVYANLYGPTETFVCTAHIMRGDEPEGEPLPIGRAVYNSQAMILREDGTEAAAGETGELCLRGDCLALGYYNAPDRTAAAFVQNPLQSSYPDRVYRTGDLVRLDEHGDLIYVSRKDFQIKRMGYRIELGEIETAGNLIPGVEECACTYLAEKGRIVLYYEGTELEKSDLLAALSLRLPQYMLPDRIHYLPVMPRNANGKIDRTALKAKAGKA